MSFASPSVEFCHSFKNDSDKNSSSGAQVPIAQTQLTQWSILKIRKMCIVNTWDDKLPMSKVATRGKIACDELGWRWAI